MSEAAEPRRDPVGPSRGAAIAQAYYYVVAAIGLIFVLGGTIAALIALRKWILPVSGDPSELFGSPPDSNDAIRSLLGALAFAIPGALVLVWHLREARRQAGRRASSRSWGETLYLYLVAAISLLIALGGAVAMLHALRDAVVPFCYDNSSFSVPPVVGSGDSVAEIDLPEDFDPEILRSEECYPSTSEALRSALDAGIVTAVAGVVWLWHIRRGRRGSEPDLAG